MTDTLIIGIAGGTGSGKSTIARRLVASMPENSCEIIEHDWYYHDQHDLSKEEVALLNFDHPDALDTDLLIQHVKDLKEGKTIHAPQYDFTTHSRLPGVRVIEPRRVVIVEGILTFVDRRLRNLFDVKLFVDTAADIRVFRRVRRDIEQRGRTFQSVRDQYYQTVRPMHLQFVEPSKSWADLIIPEGGDNQVALDVILAKLINVAVEE